MFNLQKTLLDINKISNWIGIGAATQGGRIKLGGGASGERFTETDAARFTTYTQNKKGERFYDVATLNKYGYYPNKWKDRAGYYV